MRPTALEVALRRDRWIVVAALLALTALTLGYTAWLARGFDMSALMTPVYQPWSPGYFTFMLVMWIVMMIGMMTPSVAPMVLLYAAIARQNSTGRGARQAFASAGWFLAGYLLAWSGFALLATLLQWLLEWRALVTPMMAGTGRALGGVVLVVAGIHQWLPSKLACLSACRAPLSFVQRHGGFQSTASGSVRLGLLHGFYCVGCCWMLMLLLLAFGVMSLAWIAALMIFVLLEKILPWPRAVARIAGGAAVLAGIAMVVC